MLESVSMFLEILRSVNKLEDKVKSKGRNQSLESKGFNRYRSSGSVNPCFAIYADCLSTSEDLIVFSISIFFNSFKSKILRFTVQINFSYYIFFVSRDAIFALLFF